MSESAIPRKLQLPSHVREFRCSQCGECCTNKWRIEVDALSYDQLYNKLAQLGRQQELYDNISHHDNGPRIRFLPNGKCPYLSPENLCTIQLDVGSAYMLDICKVYPRRIFASSQGLEFSLSLTCKTAVQTLQHGQIHFSKIPWLPDVSADIPFSFLQPNQYISYCPDTCMGGVSHIPYRSLENFFVEILQNRSFSVSQRLVCLGEILKDFISDNSLQDDKKASYDYESIFASKQGKPTAPNWQQHLEQLFFLANIFLLRSTSPIWPQHLRKILLALAPDQQQKIPPTAATKCLKVTPPHPDDYQRKLEQYLDRTADCAEPIMENYLVNYVLGKHFYFEPLHLAYYRLAFTYAAAIAFSIGYGILTDQPASTQIILQSIYDVENIFYSIWFYPRAANFQAGQSRAQIINNGITLANI